MTFWTLTNLSPFSVPLQAPGGLLPPGLRGGPRGLGDGLQLAAEARRAARPRRAAGRATAAHGGRLDGGGGAHDGPAGRRRRTDPPEQPRLPPGLRARGAAATTAAAATAPAAAAGPAAGGRGGRRRRVALALADAAGDIGGVLRGAGLGHHAVQHGRVRRRRRAAAAPPRGPRQNAGKTSKSSIQAAAPPRNAVMNVVLSISIVFPLFALHKSVSTRVSTFRLNSSIID